MLKQPDSGSRCVVRDYHPFYAGMHGFVVGPIHPDEVVMKIDSNTVYPEGTEIIIGHCWLEEERHDH